MKELTQTEIGKKLGYSQSMVSAVFLGKTRPRYPKAKMLEELTGINVDVWLGGSKEDILNAVNLWRFRKFSEQIQKTESRYEKKQNQKSSFTEQTQQSHSS